MADGTKIEWTDATWNPVTGCSVVSPGCTNCYAMKLAGTRLKHTESRIGLTRDSKAGPVWSGEVRLNEQWLDQPLRWRRPRRIFVCAHGDLFAENVPDEWIDRVFAVMALARKHTFQVLTKRAKRMREYVTRLDQEPLRETIRRMAMAMPLPIPKFEYMTVPPDNVWLGVSAEDQVRADERIPELLATPAAVRFVSAEPLLGPIDTQGLTGLDWIIVGGESGPDARPMHPDWARSIRDQCAAAGVPFFFKQWGAWSWAPDRMNFAQGEVWARSLGARRVEMHSSGQTSALLGKRAAGRLLDGREHSAFPELRHLQ